MKVRMVKTLSPEEVPNGSIGELLDDIKGPGLLRVVFGGYLTFVFAEEIEAVTK